MGNFYNLPTPRTATFTVAASNSNDKRFADYVCTGTNDDVQINAAITAATALPEGGKVILLEGLYTIGNSILMKSNVTLEGQGMDKTIIKLANSITLTNTGLIYDNGVSLTNVEIKNLTVDGNKTNQTSSNTCVRLVNGTTGDANMKLEYVKAQNAKTNYGFDIEGYGGILLLGCAAIACDNNGFYSYASNSDGMQFSECISYSNTQFGFYFDGTFSGITTATSCVAFSNTKSGFSDGSGANYNTYIGCVAHNNGVAGAWDGFQISAPTTMNGCVSNSNTEFGISLFSGGNATITGCYVDSNTQQGIWIGSANKVSITGNQITNNGFDGIILKEGNYCTISGNVLDGNGSTTNNTYAQIFISDNGVSFSTHNVITGNTLISSQTNKPKYGIRENAAGDNSNIVTSNQVLNSVTTAISLQGAQSIQANNITA